MEVAWSLFDAGRIDDAIDLTWRCLAALPNKTDTGCALAWFEMAKGDDAQAATTVSVVLNIDPNCAVAHWYDGLLKRRANQTVAAEQALRRAITLDPDLTEAQVSLAWLLMEDAPETALSLAKATVLKGATPHRMILLAWALHRLGQIDPALIVLETYLAGASGDIPTLVKAMTILIAVGRAQEAVDHLLGIENRAPELDACLGAAYRALGEDKKALQIAETLIQAVPHKADGWQLMLSLSTARGDRAGSLTAIEHLLALAPQDQILILRRAALLMEIGQQAVAEVSLEAITDAATLPAEAVLLLSQIKSRLEKPDEARAHLHGLLSTERYRGLAWSRLSEVFARQGKPKLADLASQRASKLAPDTAEVWGTIGWRHLDRRNLGPALDANRRARALAPDEQSLKVQSIYILIEQDLPAANREAEALLRQRPSSPECLAALAQVRLRQGWPKEAERCLQDAIALGSASADIWVGLANALTDQGRLQEADEALARAQSLRPDNPRYRIDRARLRRLMGRFSEAIALLESLSGGENGILVELARNEIDRGFGKDGADRAKDWQSAHDRLMHVLRRTPNHREASEELLRLAALGDGRSEAARDLIHRPLRERIYIDRLAGAIDGRGAFEGAGWSILARRDGFDGPMGTLNALYLRAMNGDQPMPEMFRDVRRWSRRFAATVGLAEPRPVRPAGRLRVAYLAAILHPSILYPVIAAHSESVDLTLYTHDTGSATHALQGKCRVMPWEGLEASLLANRYDIIVDTVGLHSLCGQETALTALQRRAAPVQCAWLGANWGTGGGFYDAVFLDEAAAPDKVLPDYSEEVIHIPGGQWAWEPPRVAPPPGPPPAERNGFITFGVTNRGFRFSVPSMQAWAEILKALPTARLEILGRQSNDWVLRQDFNRILIAAGVDPDRISYRSFRPYAESLGFFQGIDIFLDCFPGAGGLSSLDALWMGVPLVTLSGDIAGGAGARQGASILASIGQAQWLADEPAGFVAKALELAKDTEARANWRRDARKIILASPLCDARRVAEELERQWQRLYVEVEPAEDIPALIDATARRQVRAFIAYGRRLAFQVSDIPDLSVVIALDGSAPSLLASLEALADESDVALEVIIVDCGADDEAASLLSAVTGVHLVVAPADTSFADAVNLGAASARAAHLLVLKADVVVQPGALRSALQTLAEDSRIGGVAGRIVQRDGTLKEAGSVLLANDRTVGFGRGDRPDNAAYLHQRDVDFTGDDFLLTRTEFWQWVGGFAAESAPDFGLDLCLRLRGAGLRITYEPGALVASQGAPNRGAIPSYRLGSGGKCRLLMIDFAIPHQATGAGLPRAKLVIEALAASHHVTFYPLYNPHESRRQAQRSLPPTVEIILDLGVAGLETFLADRRGTFDVLLVSRPTNMAVVRDLQQRRPDLFTGLRIVYDAEAIFALREAAEAALKGRPLAPFDQRQAITNEIALASGTDTILCVSPAEGRYFTAAGHHEVRVAGHAVVPRREVPGLEKRRGLLFVGALVPGTPNEDGLDWFVRSILPHIPGTPRLTIVGNCLSNRIAALAGPQVRLVGAVRDLQPLYDTHRLFIAPTRFAAGVPAKVIEAAGNGIPIVASRLLADQLEWDDGQELLTAEDAEAFAQAIARLMRDDGLWHGLQARAFDRVARQFDAQEFAQTIQQACRK